ncbi:sulfide/dihydroorotate dehydrogenase-like FAD/NAD-binding protein [Peptostreptococcus russellii]|uniref:sulfide/dihydroorotate dehydrogenase-like FAD/NAD-binding protein n=1 Tax=Peptostreptococcus russellii TaxID=215200 RepID=UPI0016256C82|nr:sulfide/dihydroorotate dehydrogenase-like FAD/NAD-binding protein [Peptostreptococcus russellii]MBC2577353.1 sulfide/dihydroorotate dehydrogenase-like FAD/NAD-binding protein [Peptostreptococcus russellii]
MSYKIVEKKQLNEVVYLMDIEAPRVAKSANPGQFIIVIIDEKGERIPLTIADYDLERGTVSIVFQVVGDSSKKLSKLEAGESVADFVGPLGQPSDFIHEDIEDLKKKKIIFIAGGVGAAPVYPQVKWMHEHGIDVDVIIGARSKDIVIFEDKMRTVAKNVYMCTDDGTYGFHGNVTMLLDDLVQNQGKEYDEAIVIGPMIMMKFACMATKKLNIPTTVSLNTIMVDGTGMCGACRVRIGDEIKFACVDGPEFDGWKVDFDEAMSRQRMFKTEEGRKALRKQDGKTHSSPDCKIGGAH